jgi:hypothetical protein
MAGNSAGSIAGAAGLASSTARGAGSVTAGASLAAGVDALAFSSVAALVCFASASAVG